MKKVFILVLILPVLVFGGIKGALWYFTKDAMDNLTKNLAGFVDLKYGKIETSLQGSVSINNLNFYSALLDDSVKVNLIKLKTNDVFSLLTLSNKIKNNQIPESLLIQVQGVAIDMQGNIAQTLTNPNTQPNIGDSISTLACGSTKQFNATVFQDMGYHNILADFIFQYRYDESRKNLDLTLIENLDRLFSVKLTTSINNISRVPNAMDLGTMPQLGMLNISYDDDSLISRKITYCAKQNGSSEAEYIDKHLILLEQYLQQIGINLGSELLAAYKESLIKPGNVDLSVDFSGVENLAELSEIPIPDLIHNLSAELSINDKKINLYGLKINTDKFMQAAMGKNPKPIMVKDPNVKPEKPPKAFHNISIKEMDKYKGYQVIINTHQGKAYQGRLQIIKSRRYKYAIATRTRGGEVSRHFDEKDIKSVQAYY